MPEEEKAWYDLVRAGFCRLDLSTPPFLPLPLKVETRHCNMGFVHVVCRKNQAR